MKHLPSPHVIPYCRYKSAGTTSLESCTDITTFDAALDSLDGDYSALQYLIMLKCDGTNEILAGKKLAEMVFDRLYAIHGIENASDEPTAPDFPECVTDFIPDADALFYERCEDERRELRAWEDTEKYHRSLIWA